MTDYSHQSLSEIKTDLNHWKNCSSRMILKIDKYFEKLKNVDYLENISADFRLEIIYLKRYFATVVEEIDLILKDIEVEVIENHIVRLNKLSEIADKGNKDIGVLWNKDIYWKDYRNENFKIVEYLYADTRDLVASLSDLSNIALRLNDFLGSMKTNDKNNILNGAIIGDNATITIGNSNQVSTINNKVVSVGNVELLEKTLSESGVDKADIDELKELLKKDIPNKEEKKFGEGVSGWIGKMVAKAAQNIWNIGIGAAGSLLAQALNLYYGWM